MKVVFLFILSFSLYASMPKIDNCFIDITTIDKDDQKETTTHSFYRDTKKECEAEAESYKINFAPNFIKNKSVKVRFKMGPNLKLGPQTKH